MPRDNKQDWPSFWRAVQHLIAVLCRNRRLILSFPDITTLCLSRRAPSLRRCTVNSKLRSAPVNYRRIKFAGGRGKTNDVKGRRSRRCELYARSDFEIRTGSARAIWYINERDLHSWDSWRLESGKRDGEVFVAKTMWRRHVSSRRRPSAAIFNSFWCFRDAIFISRNSVRNVRSVRGGVYDFSRFLIPGV